MQHRGQLWLLFGLLLFLPWAAQAGEQNLQNNGGVSLVFINAAELPPEAHVTLSLIRLGGPFPYSRDGVVFGNFEENLPKQSRGYYHEYTVKTPGVRHRGARRIVCGISFECYYSADHYRTFRRIKD